ncbi:MAG TPA: glycosyltransferase N-terminal domain-containing protein [Gemmatimonadaceae bacterium]|nr:glycosyltransferase N-terminal domain-containing protein [Gemmatimonadaceae bacterium]
MHPLVGIGYEAVAQLARGVAALTPASESKLLRALRARRGIRARFTSWGRDGRDPDRPLVWIHAPSVGEGLQARPVLELLRAERAELQLAYTHFSPSAATFAAGLPVDFRDYLPFDTRADAAIAIDALRPAALIFSKLDVWPVLSRVASERRVRLGLISATVAALSSRRRGVGVALVRDAYGRLDAVGAISDEDAERLLALGVRPDALSVTGDTRYDQVWARASRADHAGPLLGPLASDRATLVAGSTWPADERVLLRAWERVREVHPRARLIVAPHEPTPAHLASIERWCAARRIPIARLSAADAESAVVLVDRVGVLGDLYALADAAYVGGGFHAAGLHSVLEPAAFGAPVLVGPRHKGSRDAGLLLATGGAVEAGSAADLAAALEQWFADPTARAAAGESARDTVRRGLGAARRSMEVVARLLY